MISQIHTVKNASHAPNISQTLFTKSFIVKTIHCRDQTQKRFQFGLSFRRKFHRKMELGGELSRPLSRQEIICLEGYINTRPGHKQPWTRYYCRLSGPVLELYTSDDCTMLAREIALSPNTKIIIDGKFTNLFHIEEDGKYVIGFGTVLPLEGRRWIEAIRAISIPMPSVSMDDFTIISVLGRGYFGKVMLVRKKDTNKYYALKVVRKTKLLESGGMASLIAERNIMMMVQNPFTVQLQFAFQTDKKFYLGQEYAPGGELYSRICRDDIQIYDARLYTAEIAIALHHLHELGIVYRDLKPENVLFDSYGHVKLTDFGFAKHIVEREATTFCGTTAYLAPEIVKGQPYSFAVDWWALGVLLCEMVTGVTPFEVDGKSNNKTVYDAICTEEPVIYHPDPDVCSLISLLLTKDPEKRPGFAEIQSHPFFSCLNWEYVVARAYKPNFVPQCEMDDPIYFDPEFTSEEAIDSSDDDEKCARVEGFSFNMPPTLAEEIGI